MPTRKLRDLARRIAPFVLASAWLAPAAARAQLDAGTTTATTFDGSDFFIGVQAQPGVNLSDYAVLRFFNKANCACNVPIYIYVTLQNAGFQKRTSVLAGLTSSASIEFWLGASCNVADSTARAFTCVRLKQESLIEFLMQGHDTITTDAQTMSAFVDTGVPDASVFTPNTACTAPNQNTFNQTIWVLVTPTGQTGNYQPVVQRQVQIDMVAPPQPSDVVVQGGNQALTVSWTKLDTSLQTDLLGYQILCNRAGSLQVFDSGSFTSGFQSCPATLGSNGVDSLDPAFVCSPLLTTTASSFRVKILQNDIPYGVSVVAVDNSGNASAPDLFYGTPIKTKSFYDVYRDGNTGSSQNLPGGATGGFCALGPSATRTRIAPIGVATALGVLGLALGRRRRRR